jgi:putative tryptophan/tyrosine transport system substrate-binding protein
MRRLVVIIAALGFSLAGAPAQEAGRTYRIGVISPSESSVALIRRVVIPELAREGFVEGQNLLVEERVGTPDRIETLAREIASRPPDVVIAVSYAVIGAIKAAAPDTPIVMSFMGSDPVAAGFADSLSRPGGQITGQIMLAEQLEGKRLELLKEAVPGAQSIAILRGRPPRHDPNISGLTTTAKKLGLNLRFYLADQPVDYPAAFAGMKEAHDQALLIVSAPDFSRDVAILAASATAAGLPTMCEWDFMARAGCLIGYGRSNDDLRRRTAYYVAQILRGKSPADLPIEGPSSFALAINLRIAKALGVQLPPSFLARADEVIE